MRTRTCLLWLGLAVAAMLLAPNAALARQSKKQRFKVPDFVKGVTTHSQWVDKYRETHDPRILYLLMSRAGLVVNMEMCTNNSKLYRVNPKRMEEDFKRFGVTRDVKKFLAKKVAEWKERYGDDALIGKTKNYYILATKNDKILTRFLEIYMEKVLKYYKKFMPFKEKIQGRFLIYIHPTRSAFIQTGAPAWSGAYYLARDRALVGYVDPQYRSQRKWIADNKIHTFFHEGFHQYLGYFVPNPPTWMNEGLADMCDSVVVRGKKLKEMKHMFYGRCVVIKKAVDAGSFTPLKKFAYMTQREYYANPDLHYAQGWAFAHFIYYGKKKKYRKKINELMFLLLSGAEREEALDAIFYDTDWKAFETEFVAYVKKLKPLRMNSTYWFGQ